MGLPLMEDRMTSPETRRRGKKLLVATGIAVGILLVGAIGVTFEHMDTRKAAKPQHAHR